MKAKRTKPPLTLDEIRALGVTGRMRCSLDRFAAESLSKQDVAVLAAAIADHSLQAKAIHKTLTARGYHYGPQVIQRHRDRECRDCKAWLK